MRSGLCRCQGRAVEFDEHLPDVAAVQHRQERLDRVVDAAMDRGLGHEVTGRKPTEDALLELRTEILVVANDEPGQRDPLEDGLHQVIDGRPVVADGRDHAAHGNPTVHPKTVQCGDQMIAADVVEVEVDPLRHPTQTLGDRFGPVVDRRVETQPLGQ